MSDAPSPTDRPPPGAAPRAALATPPGRGAVATVSVWGPGAVAAVERFFAPLAGTPLSAWPAGRIVYGRWRDGDGPGEDVVAVRRSPERVDVHGHGGAAAPRALLDALVAAGCGVADWRELVAHEEPDPLAAEARLALAEARTERAAGVLLDQYHGALRTELQAVAELLSRGGVENAAAAAARLDALLARAPLGLRLTTGWRVVLAGPTNVGKSRLLNALVGYGRAIVHDEPGVTRDVLRVETAFDGWPVELCDTAGLRDAADELEAEGVARARGAAAAADLVLLVSDAAAPWDEALAALHAAAPAALLVHNKLDLPTADILGRPPGIGVSAATGAGLAELQTEIAARLIPAPPPAGAALPFTARQVETLRWVREALGEGPVEATRTELLDLVRAMSERR